MAGIGTFARRVWFAYNCLPRENGSLPLQRYLERDHGLPRGLFNKIFTGERQEPRTTTLRRLGEALRVHDRWLSHGDGDGPTVPPGCVIPPLPGEPWQCYKDFPGWSAAVVLAKLLPQVCPPEAYELAGDMPIVKPFEKLTAELVRATAAWAWEHATTAERDKHSTTEWRPSGQPSGKMRASALKVSDRKRR